MPRAFSTSGSELLALTESGELQRLQRLRIGSVATLSRNFQENFLRPVIGEAEVKLVIRSASLEELLEQLRVHKLDLILSNRAVAADTLNPLALPANRRAERLYRRASRQSGEAIPLSPGSRATAPAAAGTQQRHPQPV